MGGSRLTSAAGEAATGKAERRSSMGEKDTVEILFIPVAPEDNVNVATTTSVIISCGLNIP